MARQRYPGSADMPELNQAQGAAPMPPPPGAGQPPPEIGQPPPGAGQPPPGAGTEAPQTTPIVDALRTITTAVAAQEQQQKPGAAEAKQHLIGLIQSIQAMTGEGPEQMPPPPPGDEQIPPQGAQPLPPPGGEVPFGANKMGEMQGAGSVPMI